MVRAAKASHVLFAQIHVCKQGHIAAYLQFQVVAGLSIWNAKSFSSFSNRKKNAKVWYYRLPVPPPPPSSYIYVAD